MMSRLPDYLGFVGIVSIILILVGLSLVPLSLALRARLRVAAIAFACAVLALLLAQASVDRIARTAVLPTEAELAERERQEKVREREYQRLRQRAGGMRFVEDAAGDELDPAGIRNQAEQEVLERRRTEPAYRQQGRQQRVGPDGAVIEDTHWQEESGQETPRRALSEAAMLEAREWTRSNLYLARGTMIFLGLFFLWDYFRRLNRFDSDVLPLPVPGTWIHALGGRDFNPSLDLPADAAGTALWNRKVVTCLRKGEQVLVLGLPDPCPDDSFQSRLPGSTGWMRVHKWILRPDSFEDASLCLEAVWYGQAYVVVPDLDQARTMLSQLFNWFEWREKTGAYASTILNLFLPADLLSREAMDALIDRANAMGIRVVEVRCSDSPARQSGIRPVEPS